MSTNPIGNVLRSSRGLIGKVSRWNPKTDNLTRVDGSGTATCAGGFLQRRQVGAGEVVCQTLPSGRIACP